MTESTTPGTAGTATGGIVARASEAASKARQGAVAAADTARETALGVANRTAQSIEGNPLSILVGGLAVGVLAGAFLPSTEKETELLSPVGRRLNDGVRAAARAAKDAGAAELAAAGISRDAARQQVGKLFEGVQNAVTNASQAAAKAVKQPGAEGEDMVAATPTTPGTGGA